MTEVWTVVGAVAAVLAIAIGSYVAGVKHGVAKTERTLADGARKASFAKIYAPANALFMTRHITTASGLGAPYFSQRFQNAKELLFEQRKPIKAVSALFDKKKLEEAGEVEYGGGFPLDKITRLVEMNAQYADYKIVNLVSRANRAKYEESVHHDLLTSAELELFYHIVHKYRKLSREYADV